MLKSNKFKNLKYFGGIAQSTYNSSRLIITSVTQLWQHYLPNEGAVTNHLSNTWSAYSSQF